MSGPPIPKLPGYTVCLPQSIADKSFKKGQTLNYVNGYQREAAQKVVGEVTTRQTDGLATSGGGAGDTMGSPGVTRYQPSNTLPQWVEQDRKVLRFYGYFKEAVTESNSENHRIRKVILYYYLEDDSIHVAEPHQDNSGIPQGQFIKRHKVVKDTGGFFSPDEFAVGDTSTVYGRTYYFVDADAFTRDYYANVFGKELAPALPYPGDPVDKFRDTFGLCKGKATTERSNNMRLDDFTAYVEAMLGKASHTLDGDKLRQFLENNKKVLRFWALWDDRTAMYGDRRPYVVHYFLEDDTIEILEIRENNSGRDPFPVFLRRAPLPKNYIPADKTGNRSSSKPRKDQCYKPEDLRIGTYLTVHGRDFFLNDADKFTKQWYMDNLGYIESEMNPVDVKEPIVPLPKSAVAPYNGYGTIEDSLQNCLSLVPKPPKRDMHKLMNKDKIILRFTVKMAETSTHKHTPIDLARRFVLSYFMMDDTIQIFEPPVRNSGIAGGKFLERAKVYKPKSEEIYTYQDLYVGSCIEVHNRTFELEAADEYTCIYMENNKHIFVMSDVDILLRSLRAQVAGKEETLRTAFIELDRSGSGMVTGEELEGALARAGLKFTRHQALTIQRQLDGEKSGLLSIEKFLAALGISYS